MTTRLAPNYRLAITTMRSKIDEHCQPGTKAYHELHAYFDVLAFMIAKGAPTQVQVPLSVAQAELDAERAAAGVTALLDDSAALTNSDRDNRHAQGDTKAWSRAFDECG